ncbi:hypothetical protein RCL1_007750 [Eukaryota sp. TZLM3-RCL]
MNASPGTPNIPLTHAEEHYKKLQEAALAFFERERSLFDRAAALQQELDAVKAQKTEAETAQRIQAQELETLWKTLEDTREDQREAEDRDKQLHADIRELEFEKQVLNDQHNQLQVYLSDEMVPQLQLLQAADVALRQDIERNIVVINSIKQQISELDSTRDLIKKSIEEIQNQAQMERSNINSAGETLISESKMIGELKSQEDSLRSELTRFDDLIRDRSTELKHMERMGSSVKQDVEAKKKHSQKLTEDHAKKLERLHYLEGHITSSDQKSLIIKEESSILSSELSSLDFKRSNLLKNIDSIVKLKDDIIAKTRKIEDECGVIKQSIEATEKELLVCKKEKDNCGVLVTNLTSQFEALQKDIAIVIGDVVTAGSITEAQLEKVAHLRASLHETLSDLSTFYSIFKKNEKELVNLKHDREIKARKAATLLSNLQQTLQVIQTNENLISDLSRTSKRQAAELKQKHHQYDVIKSETSSLKLQVQGQTQNTVELKEKLKILESERNILRQEMSTKQSQLGKAQSENRHLISIRDHLTADAHKISHKYFNLEQNLNQHIVEIDRLCGLIDQSENDLLTVRGRYELMLQLRNRIGLQLIDRNDELCVLYEKLNVQEEMIRNGTLQLTRADDMLSFLQSRASDLTRSVDVAQRKLEQIPVLEKEALDLHNQLEITREQLLKVTEIVENPELSDRIRSLGGHVETSEELIEKVAHYEKLIAQKQEELLEAELSLNELGTLTGKVEGKLKDDREVSLKISQDAAILRSKLRKVTKKMIATVAELSLYQATALNLQEERRQTETLVTSAHKNLAQGLPPTEDCDKLFNQMLDKERWHREVREEEEEEPSIQSRPNAYIPQDELGLPRPYGAFGPFLPAAPGASMRHIRRPNPKPVEI